MARNRRPCGEKRTRLGLEKVCGAMLVHVTLFAAP
jgi:hypothetical protein